MVSLQDAVEVHAGEHVTVEDHHRVVAQLVIHVANATTGSQRKGLKR